MAHTGDNYRIDARILVYSGDQALKVPTSPLFRERHQWMVFVVNDSRTQQPVVQVGRRNATEAVVESSLAEDDQIIIYPSDAVRDGGPAAWRALPVHEIAPYLNGHTGVPADGSREMLIWGERFGEGGALSCAPSADAVAGRWAGAARSARKWSAAMSSSSSPLSNPSSTNDPPRRPSLGEDQGP